MNLRERYQRLTLWNKISLWGSVASVIGLGIALWPSWQSGDSTTTNRQMASGVESLTGGDSFAYVAPQPHDHNGRVPLAIRNVGKNILYGTKLTIRDASPGVSLDEKAQVVDVGVVPADTIRLLEGVYLKAKTEPGERIYLIEILAQNGVADQVLTFRTGLVGALGCVSHRFTVTKRRTVSESKKEPSRKEIIASTFMNQDWHSYYPCEEKK